MLSKLVSPDFIRGNTVELKNHNKLGRTTFKVQEELAINRAEPYAAQSFNQFVSDNSDLLYVISQSERLLGLISKKRITSREDLKNLIAEEASSSLKGTLKISQEAFKNRIALASLIVLNVGNLKERLNSENFYNDFFKEDGSAHLDEPTLAKLSDKASQLFPEDSPLNDFEFFQNNPSAALYLLNNPDFVQNLIQDENSSDLASAFIARVSEVGQSETFRSQLIDFVVERVNTPNFDSDFFESSIPFAEYVAAGEFTSDVPTPVSYLAQQSDLVSSSAAIRKPFNFDAFLKDITAYQAQNVSQIEAFQGNNFLQQESGFATLLINDGQFRASLKTPEVNKQLEVILLGRPDNVSLTSKLVSDLKKVYTPNIHTAKPVLSIFT